MYEWTSSPPCWRVDVHFSEADVLLVSRTYCETDIDPAHRKYSQLQAAIRYLLGKEPDLECERRLTSV